MPPASEKPNDLIVRGKQIRALKNHHEEVKFFTDAVSRYPNNSPLHGQLGMAYLCSGDYNSSLIALQHAVKLNPSPPAWILRGISALKNHIVELHGVSLSVPSEVVSANVLRYLVEGRYESKELNLLGKYFDKGDRIIELGAGLGFLACCIGKSFPETTYYAIEANPKLISLASQNFRLNNCNANLMHGVAGSSAGTSSFNLAKDFWASSVCDLPIECETITVPSIDTNGLIDEIDPTLMIVDIEGGELELLPLLNLSNIQKLIVELHPDVYGQGGSTKLIRYLIDKGFNIDVRLSGAQVFLFTR